MTVARVGIHEDLPDERCNALDGRGHGEATNHRDPCVGQPRVDAFPHGPDARESLKSSELFHREIRHDTVELTHESLIGAEHDCADGRRRSLWSGGEGGRRWRAVSEADAQAQLHGAIIVG